MSATMVGMMIAITSIWVACMPITQGGVETTSVAEDFAPRALRGLVLRCRRSKIAHGPEIGRNAVAMLPKF